MKSSSFSEFYLINKIKCDFLYSQILSLIISPELISIVYGIRFGNVLLLSAFLFIFDKGEDFVEYFVALRPSGVAVYKNKTRVGSYLW